MTTHRALTCTAVFTALISFQCGSLRADSGTPDRATRARIDSSYGKLPLQFEPTRDSSPRR